MSRYHSYLNSASTILQQYQGQEPFASFLKKYFSAGKKYGSNDRKQISHLCYCFFRLGKAGENLSIDEGILTALFLCSKESNEILAALKPEWNHKAGLALIEKLLFLNYPLSSLFPWKEELSEGIDHEKFCASFFHQPDLFIRLRPGKENTVIQKLRSAGIHFKSLSENCLAVPNATKIDSLIAIDKEAVIQDYHSQKTGEFVKSAIAHRRSEILVWDCCAGSGGKSIMAYDLNPAIQLTVSDVRESILANLEKRFEKAGIKKYKSVVIDLAAEKQIPQSIIPAFQPGRNNQLSIIVADVPCTGSGTWSRTPEQLYFFNPQKIQQYSNLQKKIVSNVIPFLKPGDWFLDITCSVFKKENEEVVDFIKEKFPLQLQQMEMLKGYELAADSMFAALFTASAP